MFLVAITKDEIAQNFRSVKVEELKIHGLNFTIVIDKFLSDFISEPDGFSVVESPLISTSNYQDIVFSKITYQSKKNILQVFKSTISGRPIYYCITPNGDFFCSTHISLLRTAGVPIEENTAVLPEFFVYRYIMPPQTMFKNINQLVAGSRIFIKLINDKCKIVREETYNPPFPSERESNSLDNIAEHTLDLLDGSIKTLHPCKDRLAVLLSGGLDSSILFKLCQRNYDIDTSYSTGYPFEDSEKNTERKYAQSAAEAFQVKHNYYKSTTKDYLCGLIEGISKAEEPIHHLQSVMLYLLFKNGLPKDKDIIVLGEGADGSFGTSIHNSLFLSEKFKIMSKFPFFHQVLKYASLGTGKGQSLSNILERRDTPIHNADNILWSLGAYGSSDWSSNYFNVEKNNIVQGRYKNIKTFEDRSIYDIISILSLFGEGSVTQSIWSKLGESQDKILFYPYTNFDLLNYIFSVPWDVKLKKSKNILRNVAHQLNIPDFIITRPKSSFGIKPEIWSGKDGVFETLVPLASKVFEENEIRRMQSSDPDKAMIFWNILNYSIWKRLFIDNEPLAVLLEELKINI